MKLRRLFFCAITIGSSLILSYCGKTSSSVSGDFSPLAAGSSWTYSTGTSSYKLTATNKDTVAGSHTYKVLTNSSGSNYYLAKSGNDYYRFGAVAAIGVNNVEELYLKDNQNVNDTWSLQQTFNYPGFPNPFVADLKYTIKSKGGTRLVSGKTFNNVTQVRLDISIVGIGSIGGGDFYYAEGVGMIENAISVTPPLQAPIIQSQVLTAYEIK